MPCEAVQTVIVVVVMLLLCLLEACDDGTSIEVMSRMHESRW